MIEQKIALMHRDDESLFEVLGRNGYAAARRVIAAARSRRGDESEYVPKPERPSKSARFSLD